MKTYIIILLSAFCLFYTSCSKEEELDYSYLGQGNTTTGEKGDVTTDLYYVHYVFPQYGKNVSYRDYDGTMKSVPDGTSLVGNHGGLNLTIGPVKKGFVARVSGANQANLALHPVMKIQVGKSINNMQDVAVFYFGSTPYHVLEYKIE